MKYEFFEDYAVGQRVETESYTLEKDELIEFARKYDPQLMHIDEEAARNGPFGGLIASGWQTASILMKLCVTSGFLPERGGLGAGVDELRWLAPVYAGDSLRAVLEVLETIPSQKQPRGRIRTRSELYNQNDVRVISFITLAIVDRRPE